MNDASSHDTSVEIDHMGTFLQLLTWVRPYWRVALWGVLSMLALAFVSIVPPILFGRIIDALAGGKGWPVIRSLLLFLVALHIVRAFLHFLANYIPHLVAEKTIFDLRRKLYDHLQTLTTRFFRDERTGDIMSRIVNDVDIVRDVIAHSANTYFVQAVRFIAIGTVMLTIHAKLALLTFAPVPIAAAIMIWSSGPLRRIYRRSRDQLGNINAHLQDSISGIEVIRAFTKERQESSTFRGKSAAYRDTMLTSVKLWAIISPILFFMIGLGGVIVLSYGGWQVINGGLTLGTLGTFYVYLWMLYMPISELVHENERLQKGLAATERIFDLFAKRPDIVDIARPLRPRNLEGEIELHNLSFSYRPEQAVLDNINLRIIPGEVVGVAGPSGTGKTTLASLMIRLYDPSNGAITLDGTDLRELSQEWLRSHIGIVHQDTFLFNATLAENIAYGKSDATESEINDAAIAANLYDFILSLPHQFDTVVGERGMKLSGGEKQRVAIARTVLKNPPILILDEATSNVDAESEQLIHASLDKLLNGRTAIVIAHRLSTLRSTNRIVVLDKGQIIEEGPHTKLLSDRGLYRRLWEAQTESSVTHP